MTLQKSSITDVGNIRERNEDSFLELEIVVNGNKGTLLVVADGMGGHRAGDVASRIVTETVKDHLLNHNSGDCSGILKDSIQHANINVLKMSQEKPECSGMGSTCTALLITDGRVFIAHAGDSRAYMVRNGQAHQLTTDHTVAEQMRIAGSMTYEKARFSPQRHILTNAVGTRSEIDIDVIDPLVILNGDCYLLCTDGLSEFIEDREIANILERHPPGKACRLLVDIAKQRGGSDNITVQVAKVDDTGEGGDRNILQRILKR